MVREMAPVFEEVRRMASEGVWPLGDRYLCTDAFGVVLLVSLHREYVEKEYLDRAEWVAAEVDRMLTPVEGSEGPEQSVRAFSSARSMALWIYALWRLGTIRREYHERAVELSRELHHRIMDEAHPDPWYLYTVTDPPVSETTGLDPFFAYVVFRLLAPEELAPEIGDMEALVDSRYHTLEVNQDLETGLVLWLTHFFPEDPWASFQQARCLTQLDSLWISPPGYFCRTPSLKTASCVAANYAISLGLQAVRREADRVRHINALFESVQPEEGRGAMTRILACLSHFPGEMIDPGHRISAFDT